MVIHYIKYLIKNSLKVRCICMGNISSIISSRNPTISNLKYESDATTDKSMNVHCKISVWLPRLSYFGVFETPFKERLRNHKKEFNYIKYRNSTKLSKYIWQLKDLKGFMGNSGSNQMSTQNRFFKFVFNWEPVYHEIIW